MSDKSAIEWTDATVTYEPVRPVTRLRALFIGMWLGWGVDSIATDLWPWMTGHTLGHGLRDLAIAGLIWMLAYTKERRWATRDEFHAHVMGDGS